jgi:hypothetical protein
MRLSAGSGKDCWQRQTDRRQRKAAVEKPTAVPRRESWSDKYAPKALAEKHGLCS